MLPRPPAKFAAGFSLIELSILLLIIGLLSTTALQTYRQYIIDKTNNTTSASLTQAKQSLSNFVFQHGRLPCPADPSLAPDDVHAGIEFCPTGTAIGCSGFGGGNKVCRINGARPTSDSISPFTPDPVLTGALPYLTLGITETDAMDGWNNKLSYNVTEYMTRAGSGAPGSMSYNDQYGAINIQVYDPVNKAIISGLNPAITGTALPNSYLLAVVSHGSDGRGAYNYYGKMTRACAATGTTRDAENCNGDATFLDRGTGNGSVYSLAPGANYYDDAFVISSLPKDNDKWSMGASGTSFIYTKAGGQVGIGTAAPSAALDVNGTIRATNIYASNICDSTGVNCFTPDMLGGSGIGCNGGVMTGISAGKAVCNAVIDNTNIIPTSCSPLFAIGIDATKHLICGP